MDTIRAFLRRRTSTPRPARQGVRVIPSPLANLAFGVAVVLLAAVIVVLFVATRDRIDTGSSSGATRESTGSVASSESDSESESGSSGPLAVVIGDSFSLPRDGATAAWPELLGDAVGSDVRTYADAEAAYVARSGAPSMADLVVRAAGDLSGPEREAVSTVVLAGGRYDAGEGDDGRAGDAATELVEQVRVDFPSASVVVLSNFASGAPSDDAERLARRLGNAAETSGAGYVDVTDFLTEADIGPDRVDPTEEGQARLAERVEDALPRAAQS